MRFTTALATGVLAVGAYAQENYMGFNSGAKFADESAKFKKDFQEEFETAANLKNAPGDFNAVRLYTNIQAYSEDDPIEAFEAAIETDTKILLGVWASGTDNIDKELTALKKAVSQHGSDLTDLIIGVTIGSEDLYRDSVTGIKNKAGVGNSPKAIVGFIDDFRQAFKSGPLSKIPVGHADTWDVWGNSTIKSVIDAVDFIAVHEYPYYEDGKGNHIDNAADLFERAYDVTVNAAGGKPVWVTETGWPYVGPDWDEAEASVKNAQKYWQDVGCAKLFNKTPTFWYTLRDSNSANKMKFAITDNLKTDARFDLKCPKESKTTSSSSSSATSTSTESDSQSSTTMTSPATTTTSDSNDDDEDDSDSGNGSGSGNGNGGNNSGSGSGNGNGNGGNRGNGDSEESGDDTTQDDDEDSEGSGSEDAATGVKVSVFGMLAVVAAAMTLF